MMKDSRDQVWAYLHDELSAEERQHFEQALAEDETLRQMVEESRNIHQTLEQLSDQQLAEHLLEKWESENPEYREHKRPSRNRIIRFTIPLAAAAAAMFILLYIPRHDGPVYWQKTVYGPGPLLRGELNASNQYSPYDLKEFGQTLQNGIEARIAKLPAPPEPWKLKIQLQELANGYLAVEISGHPLDNPEQLRVWDETFDGLEHVDESTQRFAERIVTGLGEQNTP